MSQASSCDPDSSLHLPLGASTWTSLPKSSQQTDLESSPPSLFLLFLQWLVSSTSHANQEIWGQFLIPPNLPLP